MVLFNKLFEERTMILVGCGMEIMLQVFKELSLEFKSFIDSLFLDCPDVALVCWMKK